MHQVECNELQEFVRFVGLQTNPYPYMKQADAFVLSSDYEGFGMTVKEAQILNVPTFVTNFGPANETMKIGKQGEICENSTDGLFSMIQKIVQHPEKLSAYREFLMKHPVDNSEALTQFDGIVSFS
jgi:glycosyltransferase involved in cell wall biosynthesis